MSEKMNFIPANELPVAEGDEVSVLCLENGEMKQKPASGLGGGGYDIKVKIWFEPDEEIGVRPKGEVLEGDYATALEKINNGIPTVALVIEDGAGEGLPEDWMPYKTVIEGYLVWRGDPAEGMEILTGYGMELEFGILPDNTVMFNG